MISSIVNIITLPNIKIVFKNAILLYQSTNSLFPPPVLVDGLPEQDKNVDINC